jgi:hypothetical protein
MRKSNFALRLQPSLLQEARKLAEAEGVALNQLINVAVAEKLSALRTADYFTGRAFRADIPKALKVLKRPALASRRQRAMNCHQRKREQNAKRHDDAGGGWVLAIRDRECPEHWSKLELLTTSETMMRIDDR